MSLSLIIAEIGLRSTEIKIDKEIIWLTALVILLFCQIVVLFTGLKILVNRRHKK